MQKFHAADGAIHHSYSGSASPMRMVRVKPSAVGLQRIPFSSIGGAASSRAHGAGKVRGSASDAQGADRRDRNRKEARDCVPFALSNSGRSSSLVTCREPPLWDRQTPSYSSAYALSFG